MRDERTTSPASTESTLELRSRRRPIPRKGHTKSRRGCFNCKKRKIKCQENRPECDHCLKAGVRCVYPTTTIKISRESDNSQSPVPLVRMSGAPLLNTFTMDDLRFFHHFLIYGYPHLPLGSDHVWVTRIPQIASEYDYLTHAILGMAASNISSLGNTADNSAALNHRVIAMNSLNAALEQPPKDRNENDARIAASMVLCFQTAQLQDALSEFLTLLRGSQLIAVKDGREAESCFYGFRGEQMWDFMSKHLGTASVSPMVHKHIDEAIESLDAIRPLCKEDHEVELFTGLLNICKHAYYFPMRSYGELCLLYNFFARIPVKAFKKFIDPNDQTSQVLLAHFLAIQKATWPILIFERAGMNKDRQSGESTVFSWLDGILDRASAETRQYLKWPMKVKFTNALEFMAFNVFQLTGPGGLNTSLSKAKISHFSNLNT